MNASLLLGLLLLRPQQNQQLQVRVLRRPTADPARAHHGGYGFKAGAERPVIGRYAQGVAKR